MTVCHDERVAQPVGLKLLVAIGVHIELSELKVRHQGGETVADAQHLFATGQKTAVEVRLIADAIRPHTACDEILDAFVKLILLTAFAEDLILIDPKRHAGAGTRGLEDIGIEIRTDGLIHGSARTFPTDRMIDGVPFIDQAGCTLDDFIEMGKDLLADHLGLIL